MQGAWGGGGGSGISQSVLFWVAVLRDAASRVRPSSEPLVEGIHPLESLRYTGMLQGR